MTPSRNILKKLENKAIIVEYIRGSGGNLVQRIIASDNKFYWDADINNSFTKESDPIYWPKKGFIPQQKYVNNSACESDYSFFEVVVYTTKGKSLLLKALKDNKMFSFKSHDSLRHLNNNIKIIRIVGINKREDRPIIYKTHPFKEFYKPVTHPNTYNININNLTSKDYKLFKIEYLALCRNLKLTPNVKPVRNFILEWISRQQ
jgi:hypothetical protein|tara:strand:- start:174 stop:785 length:612 start_codon:yes stop_codon:yes gene_type:complete